ncbi:MAG: DUF6850 family outer membrane beta-barrel protein [Bacteroidales bacterium]
MRLLLLFFVLIPAFTFSNPSEGELRNTYLSWKEKKINLYGKSFYNSNMGFYYPVNRDLKVSTFLNYNKKNKSLLDYEGNEVFEFGFSSDGFYKKNNNIILFGAVNFTKDISNGVSWSNVLDYSLLYPYIVADSCKGKMFSESYFIHGGFLKKEGVFLWGLHGNYRASTAFSKKDPRSHILLSQFKIGFTGGINIRSYVFQTTFDYGKYKQKIGIKNVSDDRIDYFFSLKGFGRFDDQISGRFENFNYFYQGTNVFIGAKFFRKDYKSFYLKSGINIDSYEVQLDLRNPYNLKTKNYFFEFGNFFEWYDFDYLLKLKGDFLSRRGIERRYKTEKLPEQSIWNFILLSEGVQYRSNCSDLSIGLSANYSFISDNDIYLNLDMSYLDYNSVYANSSDFAKYSKLYFQGKLGTTLEKNNHLFRIEISIGKTNLLDSKFNIESEDKASGRMFYREFRFYTQEFIRKGIEVKHSYLMNKGKAYYTAIYLRDNWSKEIKWIESGLSVGFQF